MKFHTPESLFEKDKENLNTPYRNDQIEKVRNAIVKVCEQLCDEGISWAYIHEFFIESIADGIICDVQEKTQEEFQMFDYSYRCLDELINANLNIINNKLKFYLKM